VSRYQKGKTNLDFTEARDSEWQWHQLDHMQDCTSLQTDNHAGTSPLSFLQAGCPSCRPTYSVKALKAITLSLTLFENFVQGVLFLVAILCECIRHISTRCCYFSFLFFTPVCLFSSGPRMGLDEYFPQGP